MLTNAILIVIFITMIYNIIKQNYLVAVFGVFLLMCSVICGVYTAGSIYY